MFFNCLVSLLKSLILYVFFFFFFCVFQLFRKDLISAMKLPDSEPLGTEDYWSLSDPWRQEWERGVQVPVSPDSLPIPRVVCLPNAHAPERTHDFKL